MCLDATLGALQIFNFQSNKKEKGHILEGRGVVFLAFTNSLVDYYSSDDICTSRGRR